MLCLVAVSGLFECLFGFVMFFDGTFFRTTLCTHDAVYSLSRAVIFFLLISRCAWALKSVLPEHGRPTISKRFLRVFGSEFERAKASNVCIVLFVHGTPDRSPPPRP